MFKYIKIPKGYKPSKEEIEYFEKVKNDAINDLYSDEKYRKELIDNLNKLKK